MPGHDARLKSRLHKDGTETSYEQLRELGWVKEITYLDYLDGRRPPPKESNNRKFPKEAADIPPAVQVYRETVERYPPKPWWDYLDQVIGRDEEDLIRWGAVVFYYIGCGWNPTNVNNMLRFYLNGELPGTSYGNGNGERSNENNKRREVVTV